MPIAKKEIIISPEGINFKELALKLGIKQERLKLELEAIGEDDETFKNDDETFGDLVLQETTTDNNLPTFLQSKTRITYESLNETMSFKAQQSSSSGDVDIQNLLKGFNWPKNGNY